ncbi:hypothetical protein [Algirhabdus cladophorae]|uniref:hypothetical protein n=1 Tax=Algirhabdus cladophorae TaxID=3377108 RepID=UPI003B845A54
MNEVNRSSSVTDFAWISAAAFVAGVASVTASPASANIDYRRQLEKAPEISPWADIASTSTDGFVPIGGPLSYESWYFEVSDRMVALSEKQDGWKGPESQSVLALAFEHANHLLRKLAVDGIDRRPTVGLDYEGTFSFAWSDGHLSIDLTVYDDGTYSYFATDGVRSATADDALINERLCPQLLGLLLS